MAIVYKITRSDGLQNEERFIAEYDSYSNGLNCTKKGKGRSECDRFNTLGFVFSEESRAKMSASAKRRGPNNKGLKHTKETKQKWSALRKGKCWGPRKLSESDVALILEEYDDFEPSMSQFWDHCKKSQKGQHLDVFVSGNGKVLTPLSIFSKLKSQEFDVTPSRIEQIIKHGH